MLKTTNETLSVATVVRTKDDSYVLANSVDKELIRNIVNACKAAKSRSGLISEVKLDILEVE